MAQSSESQSGPYNTEMSMASLPDGSQYYNSPSRSVSGYEAQSQGGKNNFSGQRPPTNPNFQPQGNGNGYLFSSPSPNDLVGARSISSNSSRSYAPGTGHGGAFDPNKANTVDQGTLQGRQRTYGDDDKKNHGGAFDPNASAATQNPIGKIPRRSQKPSVPQQAQVPIMPSVPFAQARGAQQHYGYPPATYQPATCVPQNGSGYLYQPPANGGQSNSGYYQQQPYQSPVPPPAQPHYGEAPQGPPYNGYPPQFAQAQDPVAREEPSMVRMFRKIARK
ncbi:hypothetical protein B0J14DRAFT_202629 [Halenospora varia]|nr:hypothetical protein B0J14DRAFT_202629 [Halenospora varia]